MFWPITLVSLAVLVLALSWLGRPRGSARGVSGDIDRRTRVTRGKDDGRQLPG